MPYEYGSQLAPETLPTLDAYKKTALQGYSDTMEPIRQNATRELDAEIRGQDQQGNVAGYRRMASDQSFSDEANRFDTGLALKRADLGETLRQRGQERGWEVEDRNARLDRLRQIAKEKRGDADSQQRSALFGQIGSGIGSVVGTIFGGPVGGAALGAAGSIAGDKIGSIV